MSTCPEKDIHSLYLDNELSQEFCTRYENHLKDCEKCRKELENLKQMKGLLMEDKIAVPDLDDSFDRLMVKLSYSKVVKDSRPRLSREKIKKEFISSSKKLKNVVSYVATGVAAAIAVVIILPGVRRGPVNMKQVSNFEPMARTSFISDEMGIQPVSFGTVASDYNLSGLFGENESMSRMAKTPAATIQIQFGANDAGNETITISPFASYDAFTPIQAVKSEPVSSEGLTDFYKAELERIYSEIERVNFIFTFNSVYNEQLQSHAQLFADELD